MMEVGLLILCVAVVILLGVGYYFSEKVIRPKVYSYEHIKKHTVEVDGVNIEAFDEMEKEEVRIESPYGYKLYGLFISNGVSKKTVIISHGITWNLLGSLKYMNLFYKQGFNVLLYDHRNHGKSGGTNTLLGYYEKHDLKAWTDWVKNRVGFDGVIGVHGESMGAATVLQYAAMDDRLAFCIADCPFSDLFDLLTFRLKEDFKLPAFPFLHIANLITKLRLRASFKEVSPMRDLSRIKAPVLLIHGDADDYIPSNMSTDMYEKLGGKKALYIVPMATHATSILTEPEGYEKKIIDFLREVGLG